MVCQAWEGSGKADYGLDVARTEPGSQRKEHSGYFLHAYLLEDTRGSVMSQN
jgi:hypothetical protein